MSTLTATRLAKEYPTRSGPLAVLSDVSFELAAGESLAILGPSGSGKSTLLHIVGTLDVPTRGSVLLSGVNPFDLPEPQLAALRNRQIGFVFQDHHLLPQCSALENVLLPSIAGGPASPEQTARATELLARVGLAERLAHRPAELSGGERQRVALARALVNRPSLVLADEPTGNLDAASAAAVGRLLRELQEAEGAMLVVVTHSMDLANMLSRRAALENGVLVERA